MSSRRRTYSGTDGDDAGKGVSRPVVAAIAAASLLCGSVVTWAALRTQARSLASNADDQPTGFILRQDKSGKYNLTSPLLECEVGDEKQFSESVDLQDQVQPLIDSYEKKKLASQVSVYFRDLNNGAWMGINEDLDYAPSSMLKVPLMMAYLQEARNNSSTLARTITLDQAAYDISKQEFPPPDPLQVGQTYTVDELLTHMIGSSDNNAMNLLFNNIDENSLSEIFSDLGLQKPDFSDTGDIMSVKSYASFFRVLYNTTYLGRAMSQKALELLTKTDFNDGLVAGVPPGTTVAHKFGERGLQYDDGTTDRELHDCGIIYDNNNPYLLCVMTKGTQWDDLKTVIAGISKQVYQYVNKADR